MIAIGPAGFMQAPQTPRRIGAPEGAEPTEWADALASAEGAWAIIRKGLRAALPRARRFGGTPQRSEANARAAWDRLDVREGWAALVSPSGEVIARQSGPWAVRKRW